MRKIEVLDVLSHSSDVVGLGRCGSWRMGVQDLYSDIDIWVFVAPGVALSDSYCLDILIPRSLRMELLDEGRDDTLVPFSVYNILTGDGILNLKFISLGVLTNFIRRTPSFDRGYLDDLENYLSMQVLSEREATITRHQQMLAKEVLPVFLPNLRTESVSRYASSYWRSVFQGFLRQDEHSWRLLVNDMITYLADVCYLKEGRLPAPRKWVVAESMLRRMRHGAVLKRCLDAAAACDVRDRQQVVACYRAFGDAEEEILDVKHLHRDFWWRSVFAERLRNLHLPEQVISLAAGIARPHGGE